MQPIPSIKSRPVYEPIDIDDSVQEHVFIAQTGAAADIKALFAQCSSHHKSCWIVGDDTAPATDGAKPVAVDAQKSTFSELFSQLPVSCNLYVAGMTEGFLWDIHNLAIAAGLAAEQVKKLPPKTTQRRLFCTHCYTLTEGVTYSPYECPGCHRLLLVRDHFSKRHGAYVGVQINAEDPDDIPPKEELS